MAKPSFKAPVEHLLLLVCLLLVWLGPLLKLAGVLTCNWWLACLVHEVLWALATLVYLADVLVGHDPSWVGVQDE